MMPFPPIPLGTTTVPGTLASDTTFATSQIPWAIKLSVSVVVTGTATYNVEGWDGTNWVPMISGATTSQLCDLVTPIGGVRVNVTAVTGSVAAVVMGIDCRE